MNIIDLQDLKNVSFELRPMDYGQTVNLSVSGIELFEGEQMQIRYILARINSTDINQLFDTIQAYMSKTQ